jgi:ABC-2 type transport system ATP-binding protein
MPASDAMNTTYLAVENITHRYGERLALDNVSFAVNRGEIFGLLGPNGSGKSTLFRLLSTLIPPQTGRLALAGNPIDRHRIGVVFQSPSLDKKLTVRENIRHQGHLYRLSGATLDERITEMLERFGLADRTGERVETLSGGMRRRVELAKGLLHKPELLLLDEPSTGLDPRARRELGDYLEALRRNDGMTVVLTTHLMDEADRCDRLAVLDAGKLVTVDSPVSLKEQIGGDIVTAETTEPDRLRDEIAARFGMAVTILSGTVRIERPRGHEFVTELVEAFPGRINAVSVGKPTLEDVFIRLTGHRLEDQPS